MDAKRIDKQSLGYTQKLYIHLHIISPKWKVDLHRRGLGLPFDVCVPSESKLQHLSITPLAMSTSSESRLLENVFFIQKGRSSSAANFVW
jgi:hypothetical protein